VTIEVRADEVAEICVDTSDHARLDVHVSIEGIADQELADEIRRGKLYLGIGNEKSNAGVTDGLGMALGDYKPVVSDTHSFQGLSPGRYCLILVRSGEVVAFDWVDVTESCTEYSLIAESGA
jgi:hypothetical protein